MWPEVDDTPPTDPATLLPHVLRRGRELRRVASRRAQGLVVGQVIAVLLVVGLATALVRGTEGSPARADREVAAPSTEGAGADTAGPDTSDATDTPGATGTTGRTGTGGTPPSTAPAPGTGTRIAPVVALEVRDAAGYYRTAVLRPGALEAVPVTPTTSQRQAAVLSPDGRRIAFQQLTAHPLTGQPRWQLFIVDVDGSDLRQVTGAVPVLDPPFGNGARWATWSPDGTHLAFSCSGPSGVPAICATGADGIDIHPVALAGEGYYQPVWSPDGTAIAAKHGLPGGLVDLWLLDPAGKRPPTPLPAAALDARGRTLSWGADGSLVYARVDRARSALWSLDVATGVERRIPTAGSGRDPVACGWGQVLYLEPESGALVLVGTDGSAPTTVLPGPSGGAGEERIPASCAAGRSPAR